MKDFFIGENDFRVCLPDVVFFEKSEEEDQYNSRRIAGIMTTDRVDRQGEDIVAKGLDFSEFLSHGHFNDNHSPATSAIVGFPEKVEYHRSLADVSSKLKDASGWTCEGYVLKGTDRADDIWELAKALQAIPNKKLGFSIEGKVLRRNNKTIERANIRHVAITNCPVNTDCTWEVITKSFGQADVAVKSMNHSNKALSAGHAAGGPSSMTNGAALRPEDLDMDAKRIMEDEKKRKKTMRKALEKILGFGDMLKSMELVLEQRPDFSDEAAAYFINMLFQKGGKL